MTTPTQTRRQLDVALREIRKWGSIPVRDLASMLRVGLDRANAIVIELVHRGQVLITWKDNVEIVSVVNEMERYYE